jgi:hypothetical protein
MSPRCWRDSLALGFGVSGGAAVATAGPRRERSGKARTAGESGPRGGPEGRLEDVWKVLTEICDPTVWSQDLRDRSVSGRA